MILLLLSFNLFKCSVALNQPVRITASYNGNLYLADFPGIGLRLVQGHADNDIANIRMGKNGTELWFGDRQICSDSGNKLNVCDGSAGASSGWYFEGEMSGFYYIKHNNQCLRVGSKAYDTAYDAYEVVLDDCTENNCREKFRIVEVERDNMVRDGQDKYVHCIMNQVETANTVTPMISSNVVPVPVGISEGMAVVATNNANVSSGIKQKVEESDINLNIRIDGGKSDTSDNSIVVGEPGIIQQPVVYSTAQTQPVVYTQEVQIPSPTTQQVLVHPQTAVLTAVPEPQPVQQIVVQQEEAYTPTAVVISTAIPPNIPIQVVDAQEVPPSPAVVVQEIREHKPAPKMVVKREAQPQKLVIKGSAGSSLDSSAGKGYAISGSRNGQYIQSTGAGSQQGAARVVKAVEVEKEQPVIVQKACQKCLHNQSW
ncbi:hypothetical protein EDEG_01868 [Edhazardia aedis USNM 41457]|uniref:Ricin B lectin domain-containing protein n=1 Tax=Edhazardia aedis (strain USNM 41457) TaxID=1003232 RepID=J9DR72_EDHAE|nr:hypothetical protein EDEG_01868 [Edhazardia aedis USNM 41457]|eukprot:EJW03842.1 hypothetical protein EDEG_01868 [Edhazardia aedis USNM 41457]